MSFPTTKKELIKFRKAHKKYVEQLDATIVQEMTLAADKYVKSKIKPREIWALFDDPKDPYSFSAKKPTKKDQDGIGKWVKFREVVE